MRNVGVIFANGFEEIEAVTIVDIMRRAGLICHMIGLTSCKKTGAHGIAMDMDTTLAKADGHFDAIILPGGMPGAKELKDCRKLHNLLRKTYDEGNIIAAICAAPIALEAAGLIKGKQITCYPGFEDQTPSAKYTAERVQKDGRIITGNGPGSAMDFSYAILNELGLSDEATNLREGMLAK